MVPKDNTLVDKLCIQLTSLQFNSCGRSILWPIDSFQNKGSADRYHMTVLQAQI